MLHNSVMIAAILSGAAAQNIGTETAEYHLVMPIASCTKAGGCTSEATKAVIDSNWRWTHEKGNITNCYKGNSWDAEICPDVATCTANCAIDGVDEKTWDSTYGVSANEKGALNISFVTNGTNGANVGSRSYLMDSPDTYKMFNLLNKEFTFTVDVSQLPCGLNGALYFVNMEKDGGKAKYATNKAGARYGTGYCDAQCPHDLKWINGETNILDWNSSKTDPNAGTGKYGTCCPELDLWEANVMATQMTVHSCTGITSQTRCEGVQCGDNDKGDRFKGICDKDGCDLNPFRTGNKDFFGPSADYALDSTKEVTVVTQFITDDGTDSGDLVEMKRFYVQNGKVIATPGSSYGAKDGKEYSSISDEMCDTQKDYFTDINDYKKKGGIKAMGEAMKAGMVLTLSLWDDHDVGMIWLDATDPYPVKPGKHGAQRGTCSQTSGNPKLVEKDHPHAYVVYSNIKYGEFNSTWSTAPSPSPSPSPTPTPTPSGCPGGTLSACIGLCPSSPATAYKACVESCAKRCANEIAAYERGEVEAYRA